MAIWRTRYGSFEGVAAAVDALAANVGHGAITLLGVAAGVLLVVVTAAAVHAIDAGLARQLATTRATSLFVYRWPASFHRCAGAVGECHADVVDAALTSRVVSAIARRPEIAAVAAHGSRVATLTAGGRALTDVPVDGYTSGWTGPDRGDIYPGRNFTDAEDVSGAPVAILDAPIAARLFGSANPLEQFVQVNGVPFRVIGVRHQVADGADGTLPAPGAIVPLGSARRILRLPPGGVTFTVEPRRGISPRAAAWAIDAALRATARAGARGDGERDYLVATSSDLATIARGIALVNRALLIAIAALGLLAVGAGVVAIMMINVAERAREIGVRKALGATRGAIFRQFLVEAATLALVGAVAGLVVSAGVVLALRHASPFPTPIPRALVPTALAAAALTGMLVGLRPALRAARLDAAQALRYR